jgi:GT2 family glycosyltransferase
MTDASVVIPTRARPGYLEWTLRSVRASAEGLDAEVVVVDDAAGFAPVSALAERFGARYTTTPSGESGLNAARNAGLAAARGALVVFADDDIEPEPGWLAALIGAAAEQPDVDVFTGPIRARLEGRAPRSCGREGPPITALDLGPSDCDTTFAWGANMAIRASAFARVGEFDTSLADGGDEQDWQERMRMVQPGARVRYVATAGVAHRRAGDDARLRSLCRGAFVRGVAARRHDALRSRAPRRRNELSTLARCAGHVMRYRCPAGVVMVAHSAGRLRQALREGDTARLAPGQDDFLSGHSGEVGGVDGLLRAGADRAVDAAEIASGRRRRLARAAAAAPPRRNVLAIGVVRPEHAALAAAIERELCSSRHQVEVRSAGTGARGRFENLNLLLAEHPPDAADWLLVIDDDVELPAGFLDRFLFVCERFSFDLAQPAHRLDSHAAWSVTRRRPGSIARRTSFVEIGPVTAFSRTTFADLLPFPALRMGWGLDVHWAALARARGWACGVVDAVAIRHRAAPAAATYSREDAIAEARRFLAENPYVSAGEAERTLATHRRW